RPSRLREAPPPGPPRRMEEARGPRRPAALLLHAAAPGERGPGQRPLRRPGRGGGAPAAAADRIDTAGPPGHGCPGAYPCRVTVTSTTNPICSRLSTSGEGL